MRTLLECVMADNGSICFYCGVPVMISEQPPADAPFGYSEWHNGYKGVLRDGRMHYKATVEHLIPRSWGGPQYWRAMCVPACPRCNTARDSMPLRAFFIKMLGPPNLTT